MRFISLLAILLFFSPLSQAKKFKTSYVSFDLLNNWSCYPEGTEWICANKLNRKKASEAMIIFTAKQKGPTDKNIQYLNYLKISRTNKDRRGKQFSSKVHHAKYRTINNHMWVDGFHEASEVPAYFTRYLVTTKGNLAVLVTFSAHKDHYQKYASDFASSISSLRVMNNPGSVGSGKLSMGVAKDYIQDMIDADQELDGMEDGAGGPQNFVELLKDNGLIALVLAAAGAGYFIIRKKKRGSKKSSSSKSSSSSSRDRHRKRSSSSRRRSRSRRS